MFAPLLDLQPAGERRFTAPRSPDKGERMFGGQFLAQCMAAAQATVADDRLVNSLHAYFLRPGDVDLDLDLAVEEVRDGRSFSSRQVVAVQRGKELFRTLVSYQVPDETPEYLGFSMPAVPPPEEVTYTYDDFTLEQSGEVAWYGSDRPMDIRYINPPTAPRGEPVTEPQLMWLRIPEALPESPHVHQAGPCLPVRQYPRGPRHASPRDALAGHGTRGERASTTPCGSTARPGPTSGCCSRRRWKPPAAAGDSPAGASITGAANSPPPVCRKD